MQALSSTTYTHIESAKGLIFRYSYPHSPLLFSSSGKQLQCSPPRSRACLKTDSQWNEPLTQMVAAAYQPVFLPHSPRHSCFIKLSAVPAYPVVHSWFRQRLSNSTLGRSIHCVRQLHAFPYREARTRLHSHNCPLRTLVDSPGQNPISVLCGCEIQTCTRVITQTACLQSPEGPPQLLFPKHKPHTFSSAA